MKRILQKLGQGFTMRFQTVAMRIAATFLVVLLGFGFAVGDLRAQQFAFNEVRIEGNQRMESATILSYAGISRGEALSAAQLNDAAQRIRASGQFEQVDVIPQGGLLLIRVVEYPTIGRINFEGNSRIGSDRLGAIIRSQQGRIYNPVTAEQDTAAIAEVYATEGRVNARVNPAIIRRDNNRVDLVFEIFEGGVTEVERISFVGNRNFTERRLRGVLDTKQAGLLRLLISRDTFSPDRLNFDRQVLVDFYQSRGYADFTVQNVDVALTRERDAYHITYNVQEGQRFRFGQISTRSEIPEADAAVFQQALRLRPGVVYSPSLIEQDIARLERLAVQRGLNFVRVDPRITRNDRDLTLNVEFVLVRGERVFVERIDIEGNNTTLDRVVRSQFQTVEGDPFNPRAIRQSAERIRALGFFGNADVNARPGSSPDQVVIDVDVVEGPTGSLTFGANFSSDTGAALIASYSERNFLGRGQSLGLELSTGRNNRVLSFNFAEPQFLGRDLRFGLSFDYRTTNNLNALYDTETFRFSPSFAFPVGEDSRLSVFAALKLTDITDVSNDASLIIKDEASEGDVWTTSLGYTFSYDNRRTGLNPNAGVLLRFGQEFGVGDRQFITTTALAMAEARVLGEEVTLRATVEGGIMQYDDGYSSRVTDRFFMGSRIMRGFEFGGIGPRDADTDDALGGDRFAVARLEAEFPLGLPEEYGITGGAFLDYGALWSVGGDFGSSTVLYNDFTPRTVVGLSVFWTTPLGPLRFNFTEALDVQEFDRPRSFDVTISTSF